MKIAREGPFWHFLSIHRLIANTPVKIYGAFHVLFKGNFDLPNGFHGLKPRPGPWFIGDQQGGLAFPLAIVDPGKAQGTLFRQPQLGPQFRCVKGNRAEAGVTDDTNEINLDLFRFLAHGRSDILTTVEFFHSADIQGVPTDG